MNMGIRIQPREIEVPTGDPFKNDLLERKVPAEVLTSLIDSIDGPCALAVDAAWGNGKTTFLKMWSQHLRNQKFPVVRFNAWENDFSGDPFVALSTELTEGLHEYKDESLRTKIDKVKNGAKEVLRRAVPGTIQLAAANVPVVGSALGQAIASYAEGRLAEYQQSQKSVAAFRRVLQDMAEELSTTTEHPLIVMIDELDRCRPSYAVELLEVAKHLFSVDHIVFVLAVNRSELAHSIRALYGSGFDAGGYLRRFFDVDFRLPAPDRDAFIDARLDAIQISDYFERTSDLNVRADDEEEAVRNLLKGFFGAHDISLRRIAQAIHRLGLVYASLPSSLRSFAITAAVVLIVRTIDQDLYNKFFIRREISDLDVVDGVFSRAVVRDLQQQHEGCLFEAMIILAPRESGPIDSPLLQRYQELVDASGLDHASRNLDQKHAQEVINMVQFRKGVAETQMFGFKQSVKRLELLSSDLIDERSGTASHNS